MSFSPFGFRKVLTSEKQGMVNDIFSRVASRYDIMNDVMSFGLHRYWKDYFVRNCIRPQTQSTVLEVAGGTGDISFRVLDEWRRIHASKCALVVTDINEAMLAEGQKRAAELGYNASAEIDVQFKTANAEKLPFENQSYDAYICAFGLRNVPKLTDALAEAHRVLRPGGAFHCLEFSKVECALLSPVYDFYSFQVIPVAGHVVAGDWDSYQYLVESIRTFPDQQSFARLIEGAGFHGVSYTNLTGGIATIHSAVKL